MMTSAEGRGPADLGEDTMPDEEERTPPTQHGQTASPGDSDVAEGDEA